MSEWIFCIYDDPDATTLRPWLKIMTFKGLSSQNRPSPVNNTGLTYQLITVTQLRNNFSQLRIVFSRGTHSYLRIALPERLWNLIKPLQFIYHWLVNCNCHTHTSQYLLLTEFEISTISYRPGFLHSDLWPRHEASRP